IAYLVDLDRPSKAASQQNTAFALGLLLDYVDATHDATMARAVGETAKRLFLADADCATDTEAAAPEMVSPCLAEAAVMSRVLERPAFLTWFDKFLPPVYSPKFKPLTSVSLDAAGTGRRGGRGRGNSEAAAPAAPATTAPATTGAERGAGA